MADIRTPLGGLKFSVRVAVMCIREDRLLVNLLDDIDFAFLPGGALGTGEDVMACAAREWGEETGTTPGPMHLVGVVENFFGHPQDPQHEIGFYLRMAAPADLPDEEFTILDAPEGRLTWIPLGETATYPVLPEGVAELLTVPTGEIRHLVRRSPGS
jgi:8-oxo-dGTP pyrophosphatase MutT (NUDIX family)